MLNIQEYSNFTAIEFSNDSIGVTIAIFKNIEEAKKIFKKIQILRPLKDVPLVSQIYHATCGKYGFNSIDCRMYGTNNLELKTGLIEVIETGQLFLYISNSL